MAHARKGPIHRLDIAEHFHKLSPKERRYAHHLSKAAWQGSRIILTQVSPEAPGIFDLIIELHQATAGDWNVLREVCGLSETDVDDFLEYAATFLSNLGNYYGSGDQKFVPALPKEALSKFGNISETVRNIIVKNIDSMYATPPYSLGKFENSYPTTAC